MRKVAQRLCTCGHKGFIYDERAEMWVCAWCGFPHEVYYIAFRSAQRPGKPIKYAKGDAGREALTSQRGTTKRHH